MAKFDLHKTQGISNVLNAVQQVNSVNNILPLTEAKELLIENLYPSVENFYAVEKLDELSESIRELGILQPLLVSDRAGGRYEIIAGNRRYEASKIAGLKRLPCIVKQNVEPNLFKIMLIHANMFRVKSEMERAKEVAELKKAILALKTIDKSLKGRTSEIAGQILNLSYRQVNRLDNLNKLIPEIQGLVQEERLTASCAEQFASLDESAQKEIYEALINSGMAINREEAARLREEYKDRSGERETQAAADMARLQERLQEKERELASLTSRVQTWEEGQHRKSVETGNGEVAGSSKWDRELEKVKQALVSALQDRKELEERYNKLSRLVAGDSRGMVSTAAATEAERMINDVKRKAQLQACIAQLRTAERTYKEYQHLHRPGAADAPSVDEASLLDELSRSVSELHRLVAAK